MDRPETALPDRTHVICTAHGDVVTYAAWHHPLGPDLLISMHPGDLDAPARDVLALSIIHVGDGTHGVALIESIIGGRWTNSPTPRDIAVALLEELDKQGLVEWTVTRHWGEPLPMSLTCVGPDGSDFLLGQDHSVPAGSVAGGPQR